MEALIQQNITGGLGDFTSSMYRYFHLADKMRENGFTKISLYVNMKLCIMFDKEFFFKLYNKSLFDEVFDEVSISENPIIDLDYSGLSFVHFYGENKVGFNEFDFFISNNNSVDENFFRNQYFLEVTTPKYINFFSDFVMERYYKMNVYKNDQYKSLHFRSRDFGDNVDLYTHHEDEFKDIIFNKGKVFVCSNSYKFKEYIKSFNSPNVFMFDLPFEKEFGNHLSVLPFNDKFGKDDYESKTIDAAVECLTISDSNEVFSFNFFGNLCSLFLGPAKWKSVNIKIIPLKNGLSPSTDYRIS